MFLLRYCLLVLGWTLLSITLLKCASLKSVCVPKLRSHLTITLSAWIYFVNYSPNYMYEKKLAWPIYVNKA